jgi:hypothetical protein
VAGETTGIALALVGDTVIGASCGDSESATTSVTR